MKQTTQALIEAVMWDAWPSNATIVDFGLNSKKHYEALYYPIRSGEISHEALDGASCSGPALTSLVNMCDDNPHKGIVFETFWDDLPEEE